MRAGGLFGLSLFRDVSLIFLHKVPVPVLLPSEDLRILQCPQVQEADFKEHVEGQRECRDPAGAVCRAATGTSGLPASRAVAASGSPGLGSVLS